MKQLWLFLLLLVTLTLTSLRVLAVQYKVVQTVDGPVRGIVSREYGSPIESYLAIPFAEPPVGKLRFKRPVPIRPWTVIKNTTVKPNSCYQSVDTMFNRMPGVEMWNPNTKISEDCLYLNVWTPDSECRQPIQNKAVMVWIFGGGFYAGSSTLDIYDGRTLAIKQDVVVVSMNYRLGPLGFAFLGNNDLPGNAGLVDQQLALKWVNQNIYMFGGDRNRITIFGESAGAASVGYHLVSAGSKELFSQAIMQSGTSLAWWSYHPPGFAKNRTLQLAALACKDDKNAGHNITLAKACLLNANPKYLTDLQWNLISQWFEVPVGPTLDGVFIDKSPDELVTSGQFKQGKILLGNNADEGFFFLLYGFHGTYFTLNNTTPLTRTQFVEAIQQVRPSRDNITKQAILYEYEQSKVISRAYTYRDVLDDIAGDLNFICPTVYLAQYYADKNIDVYQYSFRYRNQNNPWPQWMGVLHGYEIDYVFGTPFNNTYWPIKFTMQEQLLSGKVMAFWGNFAKTGNPNGQISPNKISQWPKYTKETQDYIILDLDGVDKDFRTGTGLRHRECLFWHQYLPKLQQTVKNYLVSRPNRTTIQLCDTNSSLSVMRQSTSTVSIIKGLILLLSFFLTK